jgi:hypothetical protein
LRIWIGSKNSGLSGEFNRKYKNSVEFYRKSVRFCRILNNSKFSVEFYRILVFSIEFSRKSRII